ncbi:hypothetical protein ACNR9V_08385 [Parageobacillus thermoglucosidasius]|uniref:hypothetical protein n=1 Tax=Parageobacillus thermoglucosidasius TaxID=1426 RepID=UPI003B68215C
MFFDARSVANFSAGYIKELSVVFAAWRSPAPCQAEEGEKEIIQEKPSILSRKNGERRY